MNASSTKLVTIEFLFFDHDVQSDQLLPILIFHCQNFFSGKFFIESLAQQIYYPFEVDDENFSDALLRASNPFRLITVFFQLQAVYRNQRILVRFQGF